VERALEANPSLLAARYQADAAKATARQGLSRQLPTVDLIGQYQHQHYLDEEFYDPNNVGIGGRDVSGNSIGIQVNVPLFAGGALNSQRLQASYQYQASEEQFRLTHRNISQNARSLTQVVAANAKRVSARRQALVSAESVLQATQSGYEVGTRNAVDLLNAQQRLFQAQSDYANARYDYILDSLRLKALAGMLTEQDILEINGWLTSTVTVRMEPPAQEEEAPPSSAANPLSKRSRAPRWASTTAIAASPWRCRRPASANSPASSAAKASPSSTSDSPPASSSRAAMAVKLCSSGPLNTGKPQAAGSSRL
jgi:outer membrane protein